MDHAVEDDDFDGDIFIYRGGLAPLHVTHARIDESVDEIEDDALKHCEDLVHVETHDGIRRVGKMAFYRCKSLRQINLNSAVEIDRGAFHCCENLESVELGDRLETIGSTLFFQCKSLSHIKLSSIITIGASAFFSCKRLTDIEFSERLQTMGINAFHSCVCLRRIAIPLIRDLFDFHYFYHKYTQFDECEQLTTVDIVGGTHKAVASLHMDSWRAEMISEINRINQVLPNTPADDKTGVIRQWMHSVMDKMDHYKAEHYRYVKEGTTLLELALWKAKQLDEKEESSGERQTKKAKVDNRSARKERRITCGADTVIKNVLPFLKLV